MTPEPGLPIPVIAALKRGNKIEAIKLLREHSGVGLKEAKDAVEASGIEPDDKAAPGATGAGGSMGWVIAAVLVAIAAWYFTR